MHRSLVLLLCFCYALVCNSVLSQSPSAQNLQAFLNTYCTECHGATKQESDRRFDKVSLPITHLDGLIEFKDIADQLHLGDMPPRDAKQPPQSERQHFLQQLHQAIDQGHAALSSTRGNTVLRRLNRREYINTIGDLFSLDMSAFDPTAQFPSDQTAEHMDNLGDVLQTSGYLLTQYLDAADRVVEKVFAETDRPKEQSWTFSGSFNPQQELRYSHKSVYNNRYLCVYECMDSEHHEGGYASISGFQSGVPVDGVYEITVYAHAVNREHPYDPAIFGTDAREPFRLGIVPGDASVGPLHHPQPLQPLLAEAVMGDGDPEPHTMKVWLNAGQTPRFVFPNGMRNCRNAMGRIARQYQDQWPLEERKDLGIFEARRVVLKYGKMPHIRIHQVDIRGPLIDQWPPVSQVAVLGSGTEPLTETRLRSVLENFTHRAYRRPPSPDEIDRLMALASKRSSATESPQDGLKRAIKSALCSPAFLYLSNETQSPAREKNEEALTAHALAARLSYFLWSSMPDAELSKLADSGELVDSEVLVAQTRRMLKDPKSDRFITDFLNNWLNLGSLGDMPPDRDAFSVYYTKDLQHAFQRETQLFMRDLIERDASIMNFIHADYSFLNQPLATLYGLGSITEPKESHVFRKVRFENPQRGGLLGQGSVLTVTANGIETSPVVRGVWMLDNILGTPAPAPPDDVPVIDPDVRGAKSIRELLSKHRDSANCYSCHRKIDPLGFALENFDPIGRWRTTYGKAGKIDSAGELPNGQSFDDISGLKQILLERHDPFTRMLVKRLLTYGCGRRMEALDDPAIDAIVSRHPANEDGLRSLIESIVLSKTFRSK